MLRDRVLSDCKGDLYKDLAFPANDDSLFFNYSTPLAHFRGEICWLRPQEICSTPRLFSDNQYEWQVKQGMLGDCWFLCACAALQKSKFLLAKFSKTGGPILSSTNAGTVLPQRISSPIQMNLHRWCNCWCNYVGCRKDAVKRISGTRRVSGCSKHALQHLYDTLRSYTSGVIPPGQPSWRDEKYKGCFTCRIWQFGHWVEVTIDDRLPCLGGKLCFSQCQTEDVFWLPLLEKAYAKVHGSYEQLWAGQVADALVDLTGGLAERWALKDPGRSTEKERASKVLEKVVFRRLMNLKEKCVMSCSVFSSRQGTSDLGEFHAFLVVDMQDLSKVSGKEIVLLRIRNPWGRRCWKGPWREGGPGWSQLDPVVAAELLSQIQEGEFWVEEEEFFVEFDEVITGYPISEEGQLQSLYTDRVLSHTQKLYGSWVRGQSAGGCRNNSTFPMNPKFWLRVCEQSEVCIALLQKHRKYSTDWAGRIRNWPRLVEPDPSLSDGIRGKNYHAVGLHIWKVEKKQFNLSRTFSAPPISGTVCHSYNREVHLHCNLSPGYYLVVPSTFLNGAEGNFLLRVFSSGRISLSETKLPAPDNAIREEVVGGEWETARLEGCWRKGQNAGGSRNFPSFHINPCFPFCIPAGVGSSSIKVTLRQHCPDNKCCPIGFHIFQVPCDNNNVKMPPASFLHLEPLVSCVPHCYSQEVSQLCRLPSGNYAIVPSTYLPDTEGSFTVIIATKIDRKSIRIQETLGQRLQEVAFKAVMKM